MRHRALRSIGTRLMGATVLLIVAVLGSVMWLWTVSERDLIRAQTAAQARTLARALAGGWWGFLDDQNWAQLRVEIEFLSRDNPDLLYAIVTDAREDERIVAAVPAELREQYVPDVVRAEVTDAMLRPSREARVVETFLLRPVSDPRGAVRGAPGERAIEVAADMRNGMGTRLGTVRLGISLRSVDRAVAAVVRRVLLVGALALLVGLAAAYLLARWLTDPLRRLEASAALIAGGDLEHRVDVRRGDEIGALGVAFNDMAASLQASFDRLTRTLASFERFVPRKFLHVIAPEGIENIQVGVSASRTVTILFSDIRGYTSLSEDCSPREMFEFLNDYLPRMGAAIGAHGGFIDKYIGDAVMALFDDESPDGALRAALAMRATLAAFNAERAARGERPIDTGIGIHRGVVEMGTIGYSSKIESTVIGDAVNLASRIEGLTKEYACGVLVTGPAVAALRDPGAFRLRLADAAAKVKGKDLTVAIYELQGPGGE